MKYESHWFLMKISCIRCFSLLLTSKKKLNGHSKSYFCGGGFYQVFPSVKLANSDLKCGDQFWSPSNLSHTICLYKFLTLKIKQISKMTK